MYTVIDFRNIFPFTFILNFKHINFKDTLLYLPPIFSTHFLFPDTYTNTSCLYICVCVCYKYYI